MPPDHVTLLENKRIVLGVTGSIAAYKAVDLASKLTQAGARVDVIMTDAAQRFVTPLTFQSVTGRAVYTDCGRAAPGRDCRRTSRTSGWREGADLLVIAPATANTIARLAHGFADDLLAVTALAARCPVLVAPAMDGGMYAHPATQANVADTGAIAASSSSPPEEGRFASGLVGKGRLPETPTLLGAIRAGARSGGHAHGAAGGRHGGRHARAARPGALHHQPIQRQAGLRAGAGGARRGGGGHADPAARALDTPYGADLIPVDIGGADAEGGAGARRRAPTRC